MKLRVKAYVRDGEWDKRTSDSFLTIRPNTTYGDHNLQDHIVGLLTANDGEIYKIEIIKV